MLLFLLLLLSPTLFLRGFACILTNCDDLAPLVTGQQLLHNVVACTTAQSATNMLGQMLHST
jgi:hypothetical protein